MKPPPKKKTRKKKQENSQQDDWFFATINNLNCFQKKNNKTIYKTFGPVI